MTNDQYKPLSFLFSVLSTGYSVQGAPRPGRLRPRRAGLSPIGHWSLVIGHLLVLLAFLSQPALSQDSFSKTIEAIRPKLVKIHGAGGLQRLEAYQTGTLISAEGHILTAWSYVLDTADVAVTLADGRRKPATLVGLDPRLEIAVLKVEA